MVVKRTQEFNIDGKTYHSLDEMPPEVRQRCESFLKQVESMRKGSGSLGKFGFDHQPMTFNDELFSYQETQVEPPRHSWLWTQLSRAGGFLVMLMACGELLFAGGYFFANIHHMDRSVLLVEAFLSVFTWFSLSSMNMGLFFLRLKHEDPSRYKRETEGLGYFGIIGGGGTWRTNYWGGSILAYTIAKRVAAEADGAIPTGLQNHARFSVNMTRFSILWLALYLAAIFAILFYTGTIK